MSFVSIIRFLENKCNIIQSTFHGWIVRDAELLRKRGHRFVGLCVTWDPCNKVLSEIQGSTVADTAISRNFVVGFHRWFHGDVTSNSSGNLGNSCWDLYALTMISCSETSAGLFVTCAILIVAFIKLTRLVCHLAEFIRESFRWIKFRASETPSFWLISLSRCATNSDMHNFT